MSQPSREDIDKDSASGYALSIFQEGVVVGILVATTYAIAEELAELVMDDDEEGILEAITILPMKFDTINQFHPVH